MSTPADSNLVGRYVTASELNSIVLNKGFAAEQKLVTDLGTVDQPIPGNSINDAFIQKANSDVFDWFTAGYGGGLAGSGINARASRGNNTQFDIVAGKASPLGNVGSRTFLQVNDEQFSRGLPQFFFTPAITEGDIGPQRNADSRATLKRQLVSWLKALG